MSFNLQEFLFLLLPRADGVPDGADLAENSLCLLQLVAIRAVGHLLVNPGSQGEGAEPEREGRGSEGKAGKETGDEGQFG